MQRFDCCCLHQTQNKQTVSLSETLKERGRETESVGGRGRERERGKPLLLRVRDKH